MTKITIHRNITEDVPEQLQTASIRNFPGLRAYWLFGKTVANNSIIPLEAGYSFDLERFSGLIYANHRASYFNMTSHYCIEPSSISVGQELNISGLEGSVVSTDRGLTMGAWLRTADFSGTNMDIAGKFSIVSNRRSYVLRINTANKPTFIVSSSGTDTVAVTGDALSTQTWYFMVGKFDPSTELRLFVNGQWYSQTGSVPSRLYTTNPARFTVGASDEGTGKFFLGHIQSVFVCNMLVPDVDIEDYYNSVKSWYGL